VPIDTKPRTRFGFVWSATSIRNLVAIFWQVYCQQDQRRLTAISFLPRDRAVDISGSTHLRLVALSIREVRRGLRHTGRKLVPRRVTHVATSFCRFDDRASLQKFEMTPIRQVNVAGSAGDWSKQLYLHVGTDSRRHHVQRSSQHLLDSLLLGYTACQEPCVVIMRNSFRTLLFSRKIVSAGMNFGGRAPAALARASEN
jgi:hypothetical protein